MTFLPVQAIVNVRMLYVLMGVCCILIGVNGGWDEEVGLLKRGGGYQREFDYFKLCVQWPGTYCRRTRHCCSNNACCSRSNSPSVFTIHGLWAEYNDGTWPACCSGRPFDEREISTLLEPLGKYWPSLSCGSPRSCHHKKGPFWGHEWEKHGTCAYPVVHNEHEFFLTTLNVYFKYNVTDVLFKAGYVPSNSEKYPLGGIISAIENAFHATPEVACSGDALEELRICFYKNFEIASNEKISDTLLPPQKSFLETVHMIQAQEGHVLGTSACQPVDHGGLEATQQQLLSLQTSLWFHQII